MTSPHENADAESRPTAEQLLAWREIPSTSWSLVDEAGRVREGGKETQERQQLDRGASESPLDLLLRLYQPVLRGHLVLTLGLPRDASDDLLQGFLTERVIEQNVIARADRHRGRFRRFMLTALNNYVRDTSRRDRAAKRQPGGRKPVGIDGVPEPVDDAPDATHRFERLWASEVLGEVMRRMRSACEESGRLDLWQVLEARILTPVTLGVPPEPHEELAARLRLESAVQSGNLLTTAKQTFIRVFRATVAEYAGHATASDEVDEEIRDLWQVFSKAGP